MKIAESTITLTNSGTKANSKLSEKQLKTKSTSNIAQPT